MAEKAQETIKKTQGTKRTPSKSKVEKESIIFGNLMKKKEQEEEEEINRQSTTPRPSARPTINQDSPIASGRPSLRPSITPDEPEAGSKRKKESAAVKKDVESPEKTNMDEPKTTPKKSNNLFEKNMNGKSVSKSITMSQYTYDRVKEISRKYNLPFSNVISIILDDYFSRN